MKNTKKTYISGTDTFAERQNKRVGDDVRHGISEDETLISRCRSGNMVAFGQLIEKYQDRLFNAVLRMVGNQDDALELTQEAFYRAIKGLKKFRGNAGFYTWLYRIGMNLCINHHRRRQRVHMSPLYSGDDVLAGQARGLASMADDAGDSPVHRAQVKEDHRRILAALEQLEAPARAVLVLRDIEGLNYGQIASILDVPTGTVKSRLSRARATLRGQLLE